MPGITEEEAKQFISLNDDFTGKTVLDCPFYTLTPTDDGWDKVTYYTKRKVNMYANKDGDYDSWVYILSNPTMPNMYKIGFTKNTPEERARQISNSTGVALPYKVEWAFHCYNGMSLEGEVHRYLEGSRVNDNREFFQVSLEEAKEAIQELGVRYL